MSYKDLIREVSIDLGENEKAKLERIIIKATGETEIRTSWWKNNKMIPRPLDLTENDWLRLIKLALDEKIFSGEFVDNLYYELKLNKQKMIKKMD